eukprot:159906-Hanusia_phi.AAC.1
MKGWPEERERQSGGRSRSEERQEVHDGREMAGGAGGQVPQLLLAVARVEVPAPLLPTRLDAQKPPSALQLMRAEHLLHLQQLPPRRSHQVCLKAHTDVAGEEAGRSLSLPHPPQPLGVTSKEHEAQVVAQQLVHAVLLSLLRVLYREELLLTSCEGSTARAGGGEIHLRGPLPHLVEEGEVIQQAETGGGERRLGQFAHPLEKRPFLQEPQRMFCSSSSTY